VLFQDHNADAINSTILRPIPARLAQPVNCLETVVLIKTVFANQFQTNVSDKMLSKVHKPLATLANHVVQDKLLLTTNA
jgi:hypothetical protein